MSPPPSLPPFRHLTPLTMQPQSSQYPPPDPWGGSSRPPPRIFSTPDYAPSMLQRIGAAEDKVRYSGYLAEMLQEQSRTIGNGIAVDAEGRVSLGKRDMLAELGFPSRDDDIDYCLEDTPGLSKANFSLLKESLQTHLERIRQACAEACMEMEKVLGEQSWVRVVGQEEVERRLRYIVARFVKARKMVLLKYRGYVRNRRWIENVATRQRRGCLTHRQNNILRLWLFSNFGNPYPEGAEKRRLIQETGLSMTQINNWLINARSRVWKPTVELMSGERIRKDMLTREDRSIEATRQDEAWPSQNWSLELSSDV